MTDNAIRANARNQVFLTQDMVSSSEASNVLFAGNPAYAGRGAYVIAVDTTGLSLRSGAQANEMIHLGTIRLEGRILYAGPNPF
ncbi:MAG TPA: hypothetical protein VHW23_48400 [Kofleriaceae bacterium]|jgi:hypothetical protein|nr:hypothetical protein [Kofleriaceae bacterium]